MKCYVCAQEGKSTDAISVCAVCGAALCMDHATERRVVRQEDLTIYARQEMRHILCPVCKDLELAHQ